MQIPKCKGNSLNSTITPKTLTDQNLIERLIQQVEQIRSQKPDQVLTVAIDGPTASGKTILTNRLAESLKSKGHSVFCYRVDWALAARNLRVEDLNQIKKRNVEFEFEAEFHMRMDKPLDFLNQVRLFNERSKNTPSSITLSLEGLYSREHGGTTTETAQCELSPGLIVLMEGHYTLRSELDELIDLNVLLLADYEELLARKVNRVKDYRGGEEATDYFWRIDIPSFVNHLSRFRLNADIAIDNTNYLMPVLLSSSDVKEWSRQKRAVEYLKPSIGPLSLDQLPEHMFSCSHLKHPEMGSLVRLAVQSVMNWDASVGRYLRTSIDQLDSDLETLGEQAMNGLNFQAQESHFEFRLTHNDSLYNVYHRKLPLSIGIGIFDKFEETSLVEIVADVFQNEVLLKMFWAGGHKILSVERRLGEIAKHQNYQIFDKTQDQAYGGLCAGESVSALIPTDFTIPAFLKGISYERVLIGKENEVISASFGLDKILRDGGVWVQRFALFSELRFFQTVLRRMGVSTVQAGSYLICLRHDSKKLRDAFKKFSASWTRKLLKREWIEISENQADLIVKRERAQARQTVNMSCRHFSMKDGHLFSRFMFGSASEVEEALIELKALMLSPIRLLRKRAYQFLSDFMPSLGLQVRDLWVDVGETAAKEITLENLLKLGPTILAEVYLWLSIREESSSVLGANVYDIRRESLDVRAFLQAASIQGAPIVLQSSLNAIGQNEKVSDGAESAGYLGLLNGPEDFVQVCLKEARDMFLMTGKRPPLFGIGLDHVAAAHDAPEGRAKRFIERVLRTGHLTHIVFDGAAKFDSPTDLDDDLERAYAKMGHYAASLLGRSEDYWLIDKEICGGELNYIESTKRALIPSGYQMRLFMEQYQKALREKGQLVQLSRPTLFIGNLGTTHHGRDLEIPKVGVSQEWREELKSENFVSPVLHGTTNSHNQVLAKASVGCHKINVAGNFLKVLVDHLPEKLSLAVAESKTEPKRMISVIRPRMAEMSVQEDSEIVEALKKNCLEVMDVIRTPRLTINDEMYFTYQSFSLAEKQIDVVIDTVKDRIRTQSESIGRELADPRVGRHFSASMIEVPTEDIKGDLTDVLWNSGVRYFHIDAGDGKFVSRQFCGIEKASYLRRKFPEAQLHAHLMMENPHLSSLGQLSAIQSYANAGCNSIAVHLRSITDNTEPLQVLQFIRSLGCRPGLIIETSDSIDEKMKTLIFDANLDWSVVMGVPVGYGGQLFQYNTLNRIKALYNYAKDLKRNFLIEIDGGLTPETIKLCAHAGAQVFAGWSVIKSPQNDVIKSKLDIVHQVFEGVNL
jgi:ribulose-phosphate 3-epimerase